MHKHQIVLTFKTYTYDLNDFMQNEIYKMDQEQANVCVIGPYQYIPVFIQ